jgi:parallel beta-helix repeat protein
MTSINGNTLYVGGGGYGNYSKIQDAVDNAFSGDTVFVYNGTYYEDVVIMNKSINVIGENKNTTIVDASTGACFEIFESDSCYIGEFMLTNGDLGIHIYGGSNISCSNHIIKNNLIQNNLWGIFIQSDEFGFTSNIVISENILINNDKGIYIFGPHNSSHNNSIMRNTITNHNISVEIHNSNGYNTISNNIITNTSYEGIYIDNGGNWNIIQGNIITNTIDYDIVFRGIQIQYVYNTNISTNYIENTNVGMHLNYIFNTSIIGNTIIFNLNNSTENFDGIYTYESYDCNISYNIITNFLRGIHISGGYDNISILMNNISNCVFPIYIDGRRPSRVELSTINTRRGGSQNSVKRNNFLNNKLPVIFIFKLVAPDIIWKENYWGRPRFLPKIIIGFIILGEFIPIPAKVQFDWYPARKPYDIPSYI